MRILTRQVYSIFARKRKVLTRLKPLATSDLDSPVHALYLSDRSLSRLCILLRISGCTLSLQAG
jgi:hypothetical protein